MLIPAEWVGAAVASWHALLQSASGPSGLYVLAALSFAAATLIPFSSEAVLLVVISAQPQHTALAVVVATLSNTVGGMTTYALGRWVRHWQTPDAWRWAPQVRHWGAPITVLAWVPGIGDALVVVAGWLRINAWACAGWMLLGRSLRYIAVAGLALAL
ncbi:YqaA family protein [Thiomonas intermedia]|uniref:YqaA family protein n=1 Tax=Thiomonas intermedia TaxID=926 RepID=UPI001FE36724|nr:DedA family protein [Thiomonas intermedia]